MSIFSDFFKKVAPLLGLQGSGGGLGFLVGGGGGRTYGNPNGMVATGGYIYDFYDDDDIAYRAHIFSLTDDFVVSSHGNYGGTVEYLIVGGGGGGGSHVGGGGGGGAVLSNLPTHPSPYGGGTSVSLSPGTYNVVVGGNSAIPSNGTRNISAYGHKGNGSNANGGARYGQPTTLPSAFGSYVTAGGGGEGGTAFSNGGTSPSNGSGGGCLLYTSPSPRDATLSRMPSSA